MPAPRSMTARLKRLEAMVRGMMETGRSDGDGDGDVVATLMRESRRVQESRRTKQGDVEEDASVREEAHGQVVFGRTTTYVGATHFMAMLDDVSPALHET